MIDDRRGPRAQGGQVLQERDLEMLYTHVLDDAREHARKLCGLLPYSLAQVKPTESAAVIWRLLALSRELMESRGAKARRELETENTALLEELAEVRRECKRLWHVELEYRAMKDRQRELPFRLDAPA